MKRIAYALLTLLFAVSNPLHALDVDPDVTYPKFEVQTLFENGSHDKLINLIVLGDGYTEAEKADFEADVKRIVETGAYEMPGAFGASPLKEYHNFFNVYFIYTPSAQSGANADTYYDCDYNGRTLDPDLKAVYNVLRGNTPWYDETKDFCLLIANVSGGGGVSKGMSDLFCITRGNRYDEEDDTAGTLLHEFGHALGKLADEYSSEGGSHWETANNTQNTDPETVRWKNWLGATGIYGKQVGFEYCVDGWYYPYYYCLMRETNSWWGYCPVCREALVKSIHRRTQSILAQAPDPAVLTADRSATSPLTFSVTSVKPQPNTVTASWTLNGTPLTAEGETLQLQPAQLAAGENTLRCTLVDKSDMLRLDDESLVTETAEWRIVTAEAGTVALPISAAGYATAFYDHAFVMPAGLQGAVVTAAGAEALTLDYRYPAGTLVPAATPIIVKGQQGSYTATIDATDSAPAPSDNLLKGAAEAATLTAAAGNYVYKLSLDESETKVGFFWGSADGQTLTTRAHAAYLELPAATSPAAGFLLEGGESTGLHAAPTAPAQRAPIYRIDGTRAPATGSLPAGVYIVGGKKTHLR